MRRGHYARARTYSLCPGFAHRVRTAIGVVDQLTTCVASCEIYLLDAVQAQAIINEQIEIIRTQWNEAADVARLTELDRRQLYGREILNEYVFRS